MKIYNQEKTMQIMYPDLERGYLVDDVIQIGETAAVVEVEEQGHYEIEKEYPNGGKDLKWVVDVKYVAPTPSEPILENVKIYIPYTFAEIKAKKEQAFYEQHKAEFAELSAAMDYLNSTDYKAIQFAEGVLPSLEFETIKQQRITARNTVRRLQKYLDDEKLKLDLKR